MASNRADVVRRGTGALPAGQRTLPRGFSGTSGSFGACSGAPS
ncbi:hypothetical protein HDA42_006980 [Streptomyces costaricanus]|uniref:Uncharacterized protein n=1 Tax=Streptomyces murinus TaxID=33900 RepID=A0A7W3NW92_STRMR|nr:hypothetical protein [Streptomyces murinus]